MTELTRACKIEISGLGWTASDEEKEDAGVTEDFYILDLLVPEQDCTGVQTTMREDSVIDEVDMALRDQGILLNRRNLWWHSHVNMGTSPSGTDEDQIERFASDLGLVSIITNKKGDMYTRVDVFTPVRQTFENCPVVVDQIDILKDGWAEEVVAAKVTEVVVRREKPNMQKYSPTLGKYGYGGTTYGGIPKKKTIDPASATRANDYSSYTGYDGTDEDRWVNQWYTHDKHDNTGISIVPAEDDEEEEDAVPLVEFEGCGKLQDAYDAGLITPNEAVRYYGQIKGNQMSLQEVEDEIESFIGFDNTAVQDEEIDYKKWAQGNINAED